MTTAQLAELKVIQAHYATVDAYSVGWTRRTILVRAVSRDDQLLLTVLHEDGRRENVTDALNQSHWLQDIHRGRFPKAS